MPGQLFNNIVVYHQFFPSMPFVLGDGLERTAGRGGRQVALVARAPPTTVHSWKEANTTPPGVLLLLFRKGLLVKVKQLKSPHLAALHLE